MILTKFSALAGTSEIIAKGSTKDIIDCVSKLAEDTEFTRPDCVIENGKMHRDYMWFDTLIAGIKAGQITGFRIDSGDHSGVYTILDPEAPVKPLFSKDEYIKSLKGGSYEENFKKIQERFLSLLKDAQCLGLDLAYFSTECDGVHLVAIPDRMQLVEKKPDSIPSIETIDLVTGLSYVDGDKVMTLCMGEGGCDRYCYLK